MSEDAVVEQIHCKVAWSGVCVVDESYCVNQGSLVLWEKQK